MSRGIREKTDLPAEGEGANSPFLYPFVLFRPSMDLVVPTHIGEG